MKWPNQLVFVRHAQSVYNVLRARKEADPQYQEFKDLFESGKDKDWLMMLAARIQQKYALECSDRDTPLVDTALTYQIEPTALALGELIINGELEYPDAVFVSPFLRAMWTWDGIFSFWRKRWGTTSADWHAFTRGRNHVLYVDERIRELDHGLALIYNDWRLFHVFHPEQRLLRNLLGDYDYRYPNGENVPDVRMRMRDWRGTIMREYADMNAWAISHHLSLLSWRADQERLSPTQFAELDRNDKPVNCGVTIYKGNPKAGKKGRLELQAYNKKFY